MNLSSIKIRFLVPVIFFVNLLFLGIYVHQDYNISSDEEIEQRNGIVSLTYVGDRFQIARIQNNPVVLESRHIPPLYQYVDRDYPVGFNLLAVLLQQTLGITEERQIYYFRHLLTFFIVLLGLIAIFRMAERRFQTWGAGLLAVVIFLLTPRLFAEAFYNSKDLVFLAYFAIASNCAISYILKPRWVSLILLSLATALAINVRVMAIIIPLAAIALLVIWNISSLNLKQLPLKKLSIQVISYIFLSSLFTIFLWPWLWEDPLLNFGVALQNMSKFRWDIEMLFLGKLISSARLPWYYVPIWMVITIPLLYSTFFVIGCTVVAARLFNFKKNLAISEIQIQDLFFIGLFFSPIIAIIFLNSVLYDGWRQIYFIYPAFIMISVQGFILVWGRAQKIKLFKIIFVILVCVNLAITTLWMIKNHPLQNVYFNLLGGRDWKNNFDVDYWGLGNGKALNFILANDQRELITIWKGNFSNVGLSFKLLPSHQRNRLFIVNEETNADYIVTNFRLNPTNYAHSNPNFLAWHNITVSNIFEHETIISIFKRKEEEVTILNQPIFINQPILFSEGGEASAILARSGGWYKPESWGVWSNGVNAKLILPLPKQVAKELVLNLDAFLYSGQERQLVTITVNSAEWKTVSLTKSKNNQISIPLLSFPSSIIVLGFQFPNAVRPKDVGMGIDDRQIAVGLVSVTFR